MQINYEHESVKQARFGLVEIDIQNLPPLALDIIECLIKTANIT